MRPAHRPGDERGIALILALVVLLTLSALALAFLTVSALEPRISRNLHDGSRARWLAEAGIELGYGLLAATVDDDGTWSTHLATASAETPWVVLSSLNAAVLPGLSPAEGIYTVSVRNDSQPGDSALTGESPEASVATDANSVVIMRSTGTFNLTTRTIEVAVRRAGTASASNSGSGGLHTVSGWREF